MGTAWSSNYWEIHGGVALMVMMAYMADTWYVSCFMLWQVSTGHQSYQQICRPNMLTQMVRKSQSMSTVYSLNMILQLQQHYHRPFHHKLHIPYHLCSDQPINPHESSIPVSNTMEPLFRGQGHPLDQGKCPLNRDDPWMEIGLGVC